MELDVHDWGKAAEAAEKGLDKRPTSRNLLFLAGYARSRLGQEMMARLQQITAADELRRSLQYLEKARKIPSSGAAQDRDVDRQIYRATAINCSWLQEVGKLEEVFDTWLREFPDDPNAQSEWDRLAPRFGLTR